VAHRLVTADGPLRDRILDFTYSIWSEGLTPAGYKGWNEAQLRTAWGRDHLHRFALVDEQDRLLASAKRYRFDARLDGRDVRMAGIGAVFTPPDLRGRGFASEIVEQLVEHERQEGVQMASLFSEIGEAFYKRLGFNLVGLEEVPIEVKHKGGAPAMLVRAGDESDLPAIAAMHEIRSAPARFALRRDPSLIQFSLAKRRLQAGFGPPGLRQTEFFAAEEGAAAVAYVVITVSAGGWTIEEAGDRDPAGARLGGMLQVLLAREPSRQPPLIRAWWPHAFPVPPQMRITERTPARDLFMIRPLAGLPMPQRGEAGPLRPANELPRPDHLKAAPTTSA
jgi:GNAT superfamily N-acetyltransferase